MSTMEPSTCVVVADRAHLGELTRLCGETLGGRGWSDGARLFAEQPNLPFVVLAACEKIRIARRAPLILLARDAEGLGLAIAHTCKTLNDVTCAWVLLCTASTRAIVEPIVAADACTEGTA